MEINKILTADILDIIFEGRYKEYGAYDLRKTYKTRITYALLATVSVCLLFFVGSLLANSVSKKASQVMVQDVALENVQKEEKKPEPLPPPPPPKTEPPKVEMAKFTPPKIVKDEEVKPEDEIKEVEQLEDVKIGTKQQEGIKDDGTTEVFKEETPVVKVEEKKVVEEDYDKLFTVVQIPAEFPGGADGWRKYLTRNLNQNVPIDNGAPAGRYTVIVSFIVDKEGNISEVQADTDPGYGTAEEAVRIIKKGPKWKAAIQNGRNVIYRHKQSVTFQVDEG